MIETFKIAHLYAKDIIFKKCKKCLKRLTAVQIDDIGRGLFYCERCAMEVEHEFATNYSMELTLVNVHTHEVVVKSVYDKIAETFMGCSSDELLELYNKDASYYQIIERILVGQYVEVALDKTGKRITFIKLKMENNPTVFQIAEQLTSHDPSLISFTAK